MADKEEKAPKAAKESGADKAPNPKAERAAKKFRIHDERVVRELADFWEKEDEIYFGEARRLVVAVEQAFASDREKLAEAADEGWDTPA